jgi:hypothetical protein
VIWHIILLALIFTVITAISFLSVVIPPHERTKVYLFMLIGWVIPGAGHFLAGKRHKGQFYFCALILTTFFGLWLCNFKPPALETNPFYFIGNFGCLFNYVLCMIISTGVSYPRGQLPATFYDPALLYICVPALLNLLIVLNIYTIFYVRFKPDIISKETEK